MFTSIDGMLLTRGGLVPGVIVKLSSPTSITGTTAVKFMFNPKEYSITKSNTFKEEYKIGKNVPDITFEKSGSRELTLNLFFDTYPEGLDVRLFTMPLFSLMKVEETTASTSDAPQYSPPNVGFLWGSVFFPGVVTSVTEKFTLFSAAGYPVRSECTVKIKEIPLSATAQRAADAATMGAIAATSAVAATKVTTKMEQGALIEAIRAEIYNG